MANNENFIFPVEEALEMILVFDMTGRIVYANSIAKEKLEYKNEMCDKNITDIFINVFEISDGSIKMDRMFDKEIHNLVVYRKNNTCFPVEARFVADKDCSEKYICMLNDILEKEVLNREIDNVRQEAQQAMKVKSEFVANVTHELRTPVNGILGNVKELLGQEHNEQILKPLKLIERCCDDMNKIINNILDFSKLEAKKFTLEPREFHFRNMLDYIKSTHINKINEKGIGFFMTISPQVPENIIGDELRIVQVLNNLISNALKFTALGKITVEVLKTAQVNNMAELFFIVKDTGIGIDKSDKDKLFQSFSQVDASISRKYGGTGLGLNICKQLVELMGGRIQVESELNKGSTFSFSIWVEVNENESIPLETDDIKMISSINPDEEKAEDAKVYGTAENKKILKNNLSKLILCVEMGNWEKAEMFMETVRQLTEGAPREVSRKILRLKMSIQKENYDKTAAEFEELNDMLLN